MSTFLRRDFIWERLALFSSLRRFAPFVGLVGRRFLGSVPAAFTICLRRVRASSRLRSWLRCCCDLRTMMPSFVMRLSRRVRRRRL